MSNNKQTAVEWFIDKVDKHLIHLSMGQIFEQAKEMEKKQIVELKFQTLIAYGVPHEKAIIFSEQYYNEEYGKI